MIIQKIATALDRVLEAIIAYTLNIFSFDFKCLWQDAVEAVEKEVDLVEEMAVMEVIVVAIEIEMTIAMIKMTNGATVVLTMIAGVEDKGTAAEVLKIMMARLSFYLIQIFIKFIELQMTIMVEEEEVVEAEMVVEIEMLVEAEMADMVVEAEMVILTMITGVEDKVAAAEVTEIMMARILKVFNFFKNDKKSIYLQIMIMVEEEVAVEVEMVAAVVEVVVMAVETTMDYHLMIKIRATNQKKFIFRQNHQMMNQKFLEQALVLALILLNTMQLKLK